MNEDKAAFDWTTLPQLLQDKGLDISINFGIKAATALAIFLIGKFLIRLVVSGLRKVMQKQDVDKTLETFICNLVSTALLVVVVIAAIGALGVSRGSRRRGRRLTDRGLLCRPSHRRAAFLAPLREPGHDHHILVFCQ